MTDTPLSDDVVERVARAIAESCSPDENPNRIWKAHADDARVALEAARYGEMVEENERLHNGLNEIAALWLQWKADEISAEEALGKIVDVAHHGALLSSIGASQP